MKYDLVLNTLMKLDWQLGPLIALELCACFAYALCIMEFLVHVGSKHSGPVKKKKYIIFYEDIWREVMLHVALFPHCLLL